MRSTVYQHVSGRIERIIEDGPGGATNTVTPGLTTEMEWLMANATRRHPHTQRCGA